MKSCEGMGNQLSADREKDKEKERLEKEKVEKEKAERERIEKHAKSTVTGTASESPRVERQRSRTITSSTTCPPTETKINANAEQPIIPLDRPIASVPSIPLSQQTMLLAERRSGKSTTAREIISAAKTLNIKELPKPTEEQIRREAGEMEMESTRKFETARVPSETSVLDEEDLNIDDGIPLARF